MRPLPVFLVVSFGLAWAVTLPLWLGDGLASPLLVLWAALMMFTPTAGVLAVWLLTRTPAREFARETGLTLGGRPGRAALYALAAWLGIPLLVALSIALSAAFGLVSLDVGGLSLLEQTMRARGVPPQGDLTAAVALQITIAVLAGPLLNAVPSLGEEWGWRGWLLPRLVDSLGVSRALLLSGVIWGLWHAPLTLLGYNYPSLGPWAAPFFVGFCVPAGVLFGWLRLRSGSVWPAVVAHGSVNAVASAILLLGDASAPPDPVVAGLTGLVGWAVLGLACLAVLRFFPVREPQPTG